MKNQDSDISFSFATMWEIIKQSRKKVIFVTVLFAALLALKSLSNPILYQAMGTFKVDNNSTSTTSFKDIFVGSLSSEQAKPITIMSSKTLLSSLVHDFSLQGTLMKKGFSPGRWSHIKQNLNLEYALITKKHENPLKPRLSALQIKNINFKEDFPVFLTLNFFDADQFEILESKTYLGKGSLNSPVKIGNTEFTLIKSLPVNLKGTSFQLTLNPLEKVIEQALSLLKMELNKDDSNLISIYFSYPDRYIAADFVNQLMKHYEIYLSKETKLKAQKQIDYLNLRKEELNQSLNKQILSHANFLSESIGCTGFMHLEREMDYFTHKHEQVQNALKQINLEIKRLSGPKKEEYLYSEQFQNKDSIKQVLQKIRELKNRKHMLTLALEKEKLKPKKFPSDPFEDQQVQLIYRQEDEMKTLLAELDSQHPNLLKRKSSLYTPSFVESWQSDYEKTDKILQKTDLEKEERLLLEKRQERKKNILKKHLKDLIDQQQHRIKTLENLETPHQLNPQPLALDLELSEKILADHFKKQDELKDKTKHLRYLSKKIGEDNFEISSLSETLTDSVAKDLIKNSTNLALKLKNPGNYSHKEQKRLKEEQQREKNFLITHTNQAIDLNLLQEDILREKITLLQEVILEQVIHKMALLESSVDSILQATITSLKHEKHLLLDELSELNKQMQKIPLTWSKKQELNHQMEIHKNMLEEVSSLVESKNISSNLENIHSRHLDLSSPPVWPKEPKLLLFTLLGAVLGFLLSCVFLILESFSKGIPITFSTLKELGIHSCKNPEIKGVNNISCIPFVDKLHQKQLKSLRKISSFIETRSTLTSSNHLILITTDQDSPLAPYLATLFSRQGQKILIIECAAQPQIDTEKTNSLSAYLQEKCSKPIIKKHPYYDYIPFGCPSCDTTELVQTPRFKNLIDQLRTKYDKILLTASKSLDDQLSINLALQANSSILTTRNKTLSDLDIYTQDNSASLNLENILCII